MNTISPNYEPIVVTGLGPISGIGIGKQAFFSSLSEGINGARPTKSIDVSKYKYKYSCEVGEGINDLIEELNIPSNVGKASVFSIIGTYLAIKDAGLSMSDLKNTPIGCFLGTTDGESQRLDSMIYNVEHDGEIFDEMFADADHSCISRNVHKFLNSTGPSYTIGNSCSSSNAAIISAVEYLRSSDAQFSICGGCDIVCRKTFSIFHRISAISETSCSPFDINRSGIIPSEGASILLLEKLSSAIARKAVIYGQVAGYSMNCDASHMTNLNPDKINICLNQCLSRANISPTEVDYICMHGTGTLANDVNEFKALKKTFGENFPYCGSIKSMIGHSMGAAAGFGAIACMFALNYGIPPTINLNEQDPEIPIPLTDTLLKKPVNIVLNNAFAFGGNNAIVAFKRNPNV
jgi:3-oxoacyl-[acyl-carrier-protein] synthase II